MSEILLVQLENSRYFVIIQLINVRHKHGIIIFMTVNIRGHKGLFSKS